ncbi:peptide ABC transporter substrate-binding protein [Candidatus Thiomargarita nelsonii]|uniref:Peptide ABC transporter substrate-binding protein n=1 Tax=Candidatus Thiomargarita nelsonii TaxID=1003181 RepID=A0A0A6P4L4_9GAMM|nr:peptide ABC transporter substrate-binding protein [Candidatus Thiomargarita nelsonii]
MNAKGYLFVKKSFLFFLLSLILLSGCHDPQPDSLRFGLSRAPISLDPRFATDATSTRINRLLYHALVDFDDSLRPIPDLATWEQLSPTQYRFHLGDNGRVFHNGARLTAHDVKATYDFILDVKNASPHRGSLSLIKEINVQDADTIDFVLEKQDVLFPGRLVVGIVSAALIDSQHPFNKKPVGSDGFELVKWAESTHLFLRRRSDGQVIEFLEVKDPVVRALKLVRGEVDILQSDLSPELVTWLTKRPEIKVSKGQGTNFTYLGFNMENPVTGQFAVREAIAYAINREEIIHYLLGDAARTASSFLLPPTHWAGHPGLPAYAYSPKKARALLAQAGFSQSNPLKLSYKTSNNPFRIRIATVIQQQLAEVGIEMDLRTYDWGTFYGDIKKGHFQLYSLSWVGIKMPDIFRYVFHSSAVPPNGANRGRLKDPKIDALIEQAEAATTLDAGAAGYRELQVALFNELPYVPLWYEDHVLASRQRVSGYTLAPDGNYDGLKTVVFNK